MNRLCTNYFVFCPSSLRWSYSLTCLLTDQLSCFQCSFSSCSRPDENERKIRSLARKWRSRYGEMIACYFDMTDYQRVIVEKTYTRRDVVHSMLWPSVVVLACGLVFLRLKIRRHRLTFCGKRSTSADEIIDLVKRGAAVVGGRSTDKPREQRNGRGFEVNSRGENVNDARSTMKNAEWIGKDHEATVILKWHSIDAGLCSNSGVEAGDVIAFRGALRACSSSLPQLTFPAGVNTAGEVRCNSRERGDDGGYHLELPNMADSFMSTPNIRTDAADLFRDDEQPGDWSSGDNCCLDRTASEDEMIVPGWLPVNLIQTPSSRSMDGGPATGVEEGVSVVISSYLDSGSEVEQGRCKPSTE